MASKRKKASPRKARRSPSRKSEAQLAREHELKEFERLAEAAKRQRDKNRELRKANLSPDRAEKVRQQLVDDLKRVFEHPCNPWRGWAASRARYRQLGRFPEVVVCDFFGNHAEFQRAAGLRDTRTTSKVKNLTARMATEQKIRDYAESCVLNHCGKHARLETASRWKGLVHMVVLSDLHSKFVDPFALRVALDVTRMVRPEIVVWNGDVIDFPKVGRYTKMPGATNLSLQEEIDFTRDNILREVREAAPDAYMSWHIGNHEYRLIRYLADTAPEMHDLRCLEWDRLFEVQDMDIEMVFGNNFLNPRNPHFFAPRQKDRKADVERRTWRIYLDSYAVTHGKSIGTVPAMDELKRFGMSGTSGHTHRPQLFTIPTAKCPTGSWMSTGMLASHAVGQHYVDGPTQWTMGFGVVVIDPSRQEVIQQPVLIHQDWASYNGMVWRATDDAYRAREEMWD